MTILSDEFYYQPIRLDTINTRVYVDLLAKEGDVNGRGLLVTLTENGLMKDTTGIALNLKWEHTSVGNQGLDNFEVVDLSKGLYKITYPTEMLNRGKVRAFIQIIDSGKLAGTRNIEITVDRSVGDDTAIASSDSFSALASALIEVQSWNDRIDDVEQDFIDRANNLDATYPTRLVSVEQQLAETNAQVDLLNRGLGTTMNSLALLNSTYPTGDTKDHIVAGNIAEVDTLTVTAIPTVASNITITLNGVAKTVAVYPETDTTTTLLATKIRATAFTGWTTGGTGAVVTFTATTTGARTAPTFGGGTTGVTATFAITIKGENANFHRYFWNGTAWTDGGAYQAIELSNGTVTPKKTSFLLSTTVNLFNVNTATDGYYIKNTDGVTLTSNADYGYSDYISVIVGETLTLYDDKPGALVLFYDSEKNFIGKIDGSGDAIVAPFMITVIQNASYLRFNYYVSSKLNSYVKANRYDNYTIPSLLLEPQNMQQAVVGNSGLIDKAITLEKLDDGLFTTDLHLKDNIDAHVSDTNISDPGNFYMTFMFPNKFKTTGGSYNISFELTALSGIAINAQVYMITFRNSSVDPAVFGGGVSVIDTYKPTLINGNINFNAAIQIPSAANYDFMKLTITVPYLSKQVEVDVKNLVVSSGGTVISNELIDVAILNGTGIITHSLRYRDCLALDSQIDIKVSDMLFSSGMLSHWTNKKWIAIGDSITDALTPYRKYMYNIQDSINCGVINNGISGTGYMVANPIHSRIGALTDDADLITFFAGVNDFNNGGGQTLGTLGDTTDATFYGAVDLAFSVAVNKWPLKTIAVFTPLPCSAQLYVNSKGLILKDYANAIKDVANKYQIPVLDLFNDSGFLAYNAVFRANYTHTGNGVTGGDGLHPNDAWHIILARKVLAFLNTL